MVWADPDLLNAKPARVRLAAPLVAAVVGVVIWVVDLAAISVVVSVVAWASVAVLAPVKIVMKMVKEE